MKNEKQTKLWRNALIGTSVYAIMGIAAGYFGYFLIMVILGGLAVVRLSPYLLGVGEKEDEDQNNG